MEKLEYLLTIKDEATKTLKQFASGAQGITSNMKSFGQRLDDVGKSLMKIGAVGTAGLGLVSKASIDLDKQLRNIQSISHSTEQEIQKMGKTFIDLSKKLPQSATQLAEGFYNIQGSGFAGADALKVLTAAAKAASAGLTSTESASYAITSALNAYGMSADKAKDISDILFRTVDIGVVSFEELSSTIGNVLGTASAMGVTLEQVGAAISTMTKKGINASEATTALNATILAFMKPSKDMAQAIHDLGFESGQALLKQKDLGEAILAVSEQAQKNGVSINDLFGNVRALKGALALASDGTKGFTEDLNAMKEATVGAGATQEALKEQSKSVAFQMNILKNNMTAMALSLKDIVLPGLNALVQTLVPVVQSVAEFANQHQRLVTLLLLVSVGLTGLGMVLFVVGQAISAVSSILPMLIGLFTFLVSPIGLVIVSLTTLIATGYLLVKHWKWLLEQGKKIFTTLKITVYNLTKQLVDSIKLYWTMGKIWLKSAWDGILAYAKLTWITLKSSTINILHSTWNNIVAILNSWKSNIFGWGKAIANSFVEGFKNAIGRIRQVAIDAFNAAKSVIMGNSPPKAGPFKNIDQWGFNVGSAWVSGFENSIKRLPSRLEAVNNYKTVNLNVESPTINTRMDAEELALILGSHLVNSGTY